MNHLAGVCLTTGSFAEVNCTLTHTAIGIWVIAFIALAEASIIIIVHT